MTFLIGMLLGFASHFGLYDLLQTLPFPDLACYAFGVLETYPIAKYRAEKGQGFETSWFLSFLSVGIGVLIGRVIRGHIKMGGEGM